MYAKQIQELYKPKISKTKKAEIIQWIQTITQAHEQEYKR